MSSGLSPFLHFGHCSAHEIFDAVAHHQAWDPNQISTEKNPKQWWGMSDNAEAFLDQLITWRELGFNMAWQNRSYTHYKSLPSWVLKTLDDHRHDPREPCYSLDEFESATTHAPLWNAAQNQLKQDGTIHNYLRMLWGKKILQWSKTPEDALSTMIQLNNKYALDGRDPNSYAGIFWILGRYDRAWGPERNIFGKVRYMTSENTARKFRTHNYVQKYYPT